MGFWAGIKYALNSTLGTNNFTPLDQLLTKGKSLVQSSTNIYATVEAGGTSNKGIGKIYIYTNYKFLNAGSVRVESNMVTSGASYTKNSYVEILKNGDVVSTIYSHVSGDSGASTSAVIIFSANDVLTFQYNLNDHITSFSGIQILADVRDTSLMEVN